MKKMTTLIIFVLEIRLFEEKGYGFIKFQTHEAATQAICEMTGVTVNGCQVSRFTLYKKF